MSSYKEKLQLKFHEEYSRLNEKQRLAVDTIEGPVMVIAGPDGKNTDTGEPDRKDLVGNRCFPGNILCLTYTDAGVVAMRKRLLAIYWSRCLQSEYLSLSMLFAMM